MKITSVMLDSNLPSARKLHKLFGRTEEEEEETIIMDLWELKELREE